jgi:hypothetical protein
MLQDRVAENGSKGACLVRQMVAISQINAAIYTRSSGLADLFQPWINAYVHAAVRAKEHLPNQSIPAAQIEHGPRILLLRRYP